MLACSGTKHLACRQSVRKSTALTMAVTAWTSHVIFDFIHVISKTRTTKASNLSVPPSLVATGNPTLQRFQSNVATVDVDNLSKVVKLHER